MGLKLIAGLIIDELLIFVPPVILIFLPFWSQLKVSKKQFWIRVTIASVCWLGLAVTFAAQFYYAERWTHHAYNAVSLIYWFTVLRLTVNAKTSKLLYVVIGITTYYVCLCGVANYFEAALLTGQNTVYTTVYWHIARIVSLIVSLPFVLRYTIKRVKPTVTSHDSPVWKAMWTIPAMFLISVSIYTGTQEAEHIGSWQYLSVMIILMLAMFFFCEVVLRLVEKSIENEKFRYQLELQGEHYKMLQSHIELTKRVRHDLRQHLSVIQSYSAAKENEKLDEYLNKYSDSLPDNTEIMFCENFAVNAILQYHIGMAKSEGAKVEVRVEIPPDMGVDDTDLCIIFGNCIENAIEACRKVKDGERFIKINAGLTGKMLTITVDNSFNGSIKKNGDSFVSSKRKGEGIGIASVKAVADKYGDSAQFEADGNVFRATVILRTNRTAGLDYNGMSQIKPL